MMTVLTTPTPLSTPPAPFTLREYLSFRLGTVDYGIDILKVQEIRSFTEPTRIANAPIEVLGVMNLRGVVVPIVDLRLKLQCATVEYNISTVVIVLNLIHNVIGVVADSVSDVIPLDQGAIQAPPAIHTEPNECFITGLATVEDRMLILIDTESLLGQTEIGHAAQTVH